MPTTKQPTIPAAKTRRLTICGKTFEQQRFPTINLCGKWLKNSGFKIGHNVDIACEEGKLTITLSHDQQWITT